MRPIKFIHGHRKGESGVFHEFGRCDNGSEAATCAIVEANDGTISFYDLPHIQFLENVSKTNNQIITEYLIDICHLSDTDTDEILKEKILDAYGYLDKAGLL